MPTADNYNDTIVTFGIILDHSYERAWAHHDYMQDLEEQAEYTDEVDALEWWYTEWHRLHPGVTDCRHGLSLDNCFDPVNHYSDQY